MLGVQTLAIGNHKGGVAKTTTTATIGAVMARRDRRVLLIDADPQAGLTRLLGARYPQGLADVIGLGAPGVAITRATMHLAPQLDLVPASRELAACELAITARVAREGILSRALSLVSDAYDVCLIDCPPSLGLLAVNALAAAAGVIVPTRAAALDLGAVADYLATVATIQDAINPRLRLVGVLVTMATKTNAAVDAIDAVRAAGWPLLGVIGQSTAVAEAAALRQVITEYDPRNERAAEYERTTTEIERWISDATK